MLTTAISTPVSLINTLIPPKAMSDREVKEMQRRIDKGILLAQQRLVERARLFGTTLVVMRDGQVMDLSPDEL